MHCPNCGATVEKGARFCGACGCKLQAFNAAQQSRPTQKSTAYQPAQQTAQERPTAKQTQGQSASGYRPTHAKKKNSNGLRIALGCLIGLGVIAIAVFATILIMRNQAPAELSTEPSASQTEPAPTDTPTETPAPTETQAPTEPAPTEAPTEPTEPGEIRIDAATQEKLNLFLSNFSESNFGSYDPNGSKSFDRIMLIFSWYNLNKRDQMKFSADYDAMLSYEQVNERHERFFGQTLRKPEEGERYTSDYGQRIYYQDGYFMTPWGDGDSHPNFTVAKQLKDNGDGSYTVLFDVYSAEDYAAGGDHLTDASYYRLTPENVTSRNVQYQYSGKAVVVPYKTGMIDSYQLKEYTLD